MKKILFSSKSNLLDQMTLSILPQTNLINLTSRIDELNQKITAENQLTNNQMVQAKGRSEEERGGQSTPLLLLGVPAIFTRRLKTK